MIGRIAWALLAGGSLCTALLAEPPLASADQLIRQLSSPEFRLREAAARALEQQGQAALPALRRAATSADPEVKQRAALLLARLERHHLLAPSHVTVHAEQKPVSEVLAQLTQQTGYKLSCNSDKSQIISVHAEEQRFWEVIDRISSQTGLALQTYQDSSGALMFQRTERISPHVVYSGPFRLCPGSFHLSKTLELSLPRQFAPPGQQRTDALTLTFQLVSEPKTPLMSLGQPRIALAIDNHGASLVPPQGQAYESHYHHYYYGYRNPVLQTQVQLLGHGNAITLRHIKGTIPVVFLAEQRPEITINDILKVKNAKFEGNQVSIEIEEVKEGPGKQVHVKATARRGGADQQQDYTWTNSLGQRVELFDEQGRKFHCEGFNWDSGNPTSVSGTFQFGDGGAKLGKAAKLIYYDWITSQHQVDFEFRDLPLP